MKNLKKLVSLLLAISMLLALAACGGGEDDGKVDDDNGDAVLLDDHSLYLTTDSGTIDDKSFNQASWEGLKQYADENGVEANYIRPIDEGDQNYLQAIEQAANAGAKVIVTPGFLFETAIGEAQIKYPDIKFICVDFEPKNAETEEIQIDNNTVAVQYKEEQSGFLAGYAAVKEGHTKLGYMGGMSTPPVIRYGFGFIAGANYAAEELGKDVEMKYNYTGTFNETPEIKTMSASWYEAGTEVIFVAGGGIYRSIISAAQEAGTLIFGVDADQKDEGIQVQTSAMKNLKGTVYEMVKKGIEGDFPGGESLNLGIESNAVQLSDDFSRFNNFTEEDYKVIYKMLEDNEDGIIDKMPKIDTSLPQNDQSDPTLLDGYDNVQIEYYQ